MCLMFTPQEPSDTLLVLAPLQPDGGVARWQLTYVNSVGQTAAAKSPFGNGKTFEDEQVLMVVPFPNRGGLGEKDVILSVVFPHQVSKMRSSARAARRWTSSASTGYPNDASPLLLSTDRHGAAGGLWQRQH